MRHLVFGGEAVSIASKVGMCFTNSNDHAGTVRARDPPGGAYQCDCYTSRIFKKPAAPTDSPDEAFKLACCGKVGLRPSHTALTSAPPVVKARILKPGGSEGHFGGGV
jgi:hypothetical protein